MPDYVIPQNPFSLLHRNREARWHKQQLLFGPEASHRSLAALSLLVRKPLPAVIPDAAPTCEICIAKIHPQVPVRLQAMQCALKYLGQVRDVPFRIGFEPQDSTLRSVPTVAGRVISGFSNAPYVVEEFPIVLEFVFAMAPVGGTGNYQVN
jgi:hypothetical protein